MERDESEAGKRKRRLHLPHPHLRPLPLWLRITLLFLGWLVLLVGIAGLVLPGIQGILTIIVGAAILSVASERVYRALKALLKRWPSIHDRFDRFRERVHKKLSRKR